MPAFSTHILNKGLNSERQKGMYTCVLMYDTQRVTET